MVRAKLQRSASPILPNQAFGTKAELPALVIGATLEEESLLSQEKNVTTSKNSTEDCSMKGRPSISGF